MVSLPVSMMPSSRWRILRYISSKIRTFEKNSQKKKTFEEKKKQCKIRSASAPKCVCEAHILSMGPVRPNSIAARPKNPTEFLERECISPWRRTSLLAVHNIGVCPIRRSAAHPAVSAQAPRLSPPASRPGASCCSERRGRDL
jgi:hypothetical protein